MKSHYLLAGFILLQIVANAQVKIGDNATSINSASILELETTNKGFVLPRVSLTATSSSSPLDAGLLTSTIVYNTNSSTTGGSGIGVYYWDGSKWNYLVNAASLNYWSLTGNGGLSASTNFIGTTDAVDLVVKTNNATRMRIKSNTGFVGINTTSPSERLHVVGNFYLNGAFMPGGDAGTSGYILTSAGAGISPTWSNPNSLAWTLTGNSGTNASTNFIGTTDAIDFVTKTSNTERMRVTSGGNIGINTSNPGSALDVKGTLRLSGSTSGYVALAPAAAAGATTYTLPSADGTAGQALVTNGSGTLGWAITAATIGTIGTGVNIPGTATGKYYCTGS
ncbi:MAG TPA: hypothetical protein VHD33_04605, partial [Legionellaceae bacterium]|nr:hypothetical protein [Legionellaceae bacterium]